MPEDVPEGGVIDDVVGGGSFFAIYPHYCHCEALRPGIDYIQILAVSIPSCAWYGD